MLLAAVLDGSVLGVALFAIALIAILPPIQPLIEAKLSIWRSKGLKLFIWLLLFFGSLLSLSSSLVSLEDIALCHEPSGNGCAESQSYFVEQTLPIYLTTQASGFEGTLPIEIEVSYVAQPGKTVVVGTEVFELDITGDSVQVALPLDQLPVGSYTVELSDADENDNQLLDQKARFTVWPTQGDVSARVDQSLENAPIKLTSLKLCNETDQAGDCPAEGQTTFPDWATDIAATVDIDDHSTAELTYIWRVYEADEIFEIGGETVSVDENTGSFTYSLGGDEPYPPGDYEVIVFAETNRSTPLRQTFTVE